MKNTVLTVTNRAPVVIPAGARVFVLTTTNLCQLITGKLIRALEREGLKVSSFAIPDGERHKTLKTVSDCYDWLARERADRSSILVIVGGGVVGDMGGFVAATYNRGMRYVQVPTTFVSQIDSSIGGKVGVDHRLGKNLIGAFYQPLHIHIDTRYLLTLPPVEYLCGLAEVIKYAAIRDAPLFDFLARNKDSLLKRNHQATMKIVKRCCEIKMEIVEADERETSGKRMVLNFGHTVGHAIEKLGSYKKYRHGEAVAIGMVAAAGISERLGYCPKKSAEGLCGLIKSYGLPTKIPHFSRREWIDALSRDKKMRGGDLNFVFLKRIGRVKVAKISPAEVAQWITRS